MNKLYTYVYVDNDAALHNSLRVGLRQEGLLKDHFYLPPGEFVDVHAMGLTRAQLLQDERLKSLVRRRLALTWTT
jgi:RimJ/RimL family protein N-acetyltransferase